MTKAERNWYLKQAQADYGDSHLTPDGFLERCVWRNLLRWASGIYF